VIQHGIIGLAGYEVREKISLGSHSSAYRGVRLSDNQPVVIKAPTAKFVSHELINRFRSEFDIGSRFDNALIIKYHALEPYQNGLAIVSEDFGGVKLSELIPDGGMEIATFLDIAIQIAEGLGIIHGENVIHKDLKPGNIAISPGNKAIKYLDFGISTRAELTAFHGIDLAASGGTLEYISPEQTGRTNRLIDYRSDLYSLGITFYQMICGSVPFSSEDALELIHSHIAKTPPNPSERRPDIPQAISDIILKLLQKNAEDRYQSAFGVKADLEACRDLLAKGEPLHGFEIGKFDFSGKFRLSQKLYGREKEIAQLLAIFERASRGKSEMLLVTGYSGVGKSAVISELQKPVATRHGYFIAGKFDQYNRGSAYSAIAQAFHGLIQLLLGEPENRISAWREKLLAALGENGQIVIDVIPAVESIIGKQAAVRNLGPVESQNRFDLTFSKFVRVFAKEEHPLVMFLDDIHHADMASLKLLKMLATDPELDHFMLVCAYRDNEVDATHPAQLAIDEIEETRGEVERMSLAPLDIANTSLLVAEALGCSTEASAPVADEVYRKTGGNAFFVKLFLQAAHEDLLLKFAHPAGWQWDIEGIRAMQATDNVAELMLRKFNSFPEETRNALKLAASLGNTWSVATLALVREHSDGQVRQDIQPVLNLGMIVQEGNGFRFVHDRIHEAAYSLIPEDKKPSVHLRIGEILLQNLPNDENVKAVIDAVNHLNISGHLIQSKQKRIRVARLNLLAGRQAKKNTAYASARQYFIAGITHLPETAWEEEFELCFALHQEWAEAEYLTGDFAKSQEIIHLLLEKSDSAIGKADLYGMLIYQYTVTADYQKGISTGREALKLLGIELPEENLEAALHAEIAKAKTNLGDRQIDALMDAPKMTSRSHRAAMRILMEMQPTTYMADPELYSVIAVVMANLSLYYGHTHESAKAYVTYANILSSVLHEYHDGYAFCQLGLKMSERYNDPVQKCRGIFINTAFLLHWTRSFDEGDAAFDEGYRTGVECGDFQYAGYILGFGVANLFNKGMPLARLSEKLDGFMGFVKKAKHQMPIDTIQGFQLAVANLRGETGGKLSFDTKGMTEQQFVEDCKKRNVVALAYFLVLKAQVLYLHKKHEGALDCILEATKILDHIRGTSTMAEFNFYHSLILAALYPSRDAATQKQYLEQIEANQRQMKLWADICADNFLHKYLLVEAEKARITGNDVPAIRAYDLAISAAVKSDFIQNEALAYELAAGFWLDFGKEDFAHIYLNHASQCYRHWGAAALVEGIEKIHTLAKPSTTSFTTPHRTSISTPDHASSGFDVASILKASQAISGEIVLDKLLEKTMEIVVENAGAQRGFLILKEKGQLTIAAEIDIGNGKEFHLRAIPVEESQGLARSIVNYADRTAQCIVLGDASNEGLFTRDPYVIANKLKSVLCMPVIKQGELFAILYLENNFATDTFTPARLQILNLITSQIGVSIENARLYQSIEKKVDERTRQLQEKSAQLNRANEEMAAEIEQRKLLEEELRRLATTDYLTGLFIRRKLFELGETEINRAKRNGSPLALMILDIDHFKSINDTYGHAIGDEVLKAFAAVFRDSLRNVDSVCRFGGEEFVAILPDTDIQHAMEVAQRLRQNVEASTLPVEGKQLKYTISIGLTRLLERDTLVSELILRADEALYHSKNTGRNRVTLAPED
jgi:diguanylate cyclase (GGDEF)-like protein